MEPSPHHALVVSLGDVDHLTGATSHTSGRWRSIVGRVGGEDADRRG